jgi:hypothetical protein
MLSVTLQTQLPQQLNRMAGELEAAQEKALDRVAEVALHAKQREVGRTYARPIPRRKNGRPQWTRSGDWQRGQTITRRRLVRLVGATNRSRVYEPRLATLRTERRNPAAEEALRRIEPQVGPVFRQEIKNALGL